MVYFKTLLLIALIIVIADTKKHKKSKKNNKFDCSLYPLIDCSPDCCYPICASNGICTKEFCNECFFNVQNCIAKENGKPKWKPVESCDCDCIDRCSDCYDPVCGFVDGVYRQFASKCALDQINCEQNNNWIVVEECYCEPVCTKCEADCTKEYRPICAYNGITFQTFSNPCLLEIANCKEKNKWGQFYIGECSDCLFKPIFYIK